MKLSDWQDGMPPCNGIWQIRIPEHDSPGHIQTYYARFKDGQWGVGCGCVKAVQNTKSLVPYFNNNNPDNPRKWRGIIDE